MALKKINVTKSTNTTADGNHITREEIIKLSEDWSDNQQTIFKKIVKQGGTVNIKGKKYICIPGEKVTNSQSQRDGGAAKMHGPEE